MIRLRHCITLAAWAALPALTVVGAEPACQDTTAIRWHTPGQFGAARQEAAERKRLLMIKGIAFGVDEAGATCATKGCW